MNILILEHNGYKGWAVTKTAVVDPLMPDFNKQSCEVALRIWLGEDFALRDMGKITTHKDVTISCMGEEIGYTFIKQG